MKLFHLANIIDKTFNEVAVEDKKLISWFLRNTEERIDYDSFREIV